MTGTTYTDVGFAFYCPVLDAKDKPIRHDSCAPSRSVVMRERKHTKGSAETEVGTQSQHRGGRVLTHDAAETWGGEQSHGTEARRQGRLGEGECPLVVLCWQLRVQD